MTINPIDLIARKRDGQALPASEIRELVDAYTRDDLPDYQMSAFLMAAYLNGLNEEETEALTHSMLHSGKVLDLTDIPGIKVDKHSTGGVGDKVSLILAPVVAACGVRVPMISGRGLGHSGGTLDKLESIPGFRVNLSVAEYKAQLSRIGVVMVGQTDELAPADRKIYALRDVTATIDNISFIAPSIMSKKIAAGIDALVLDVKCGVGAFMKTRERAKALAERLISIGEAFGKPAVAWMTAMEQPLGHAVGNWPEVAESVRCLRGEWVDDLIRVTLTLAGEMLYLGQKAGDPVEGYSLAKNAIDDGRAYKKFVEMVEAQGGDVALVEEPERRPMAVHTIEVRVPDGVAGFVSGVDALKIGRIAVQLGAGRLKKEDAVDPLAGLNLACKTGDPVRPGDLLATLFTNKKIDLAACRERTLAAFVFSEEKPPVSELLLGRYTKAGWEKERDD